MLKVLVLQRFHDLSDEQTEYQLGDRFSFLRFVGLRPGDQVPDHSTIWSFKDRLGEAGMHSRMSRLRARVEHVFGRIKPFGRDSCRRIGIRRARFEIALTNLTYNLDRYAMFRAA